jgi:tRNA A-37 threonylcarbamoyl transferase component Bud32
MDRIISYDLPSGRTLGPQYEIIDFVGGGWEGEVYKVQERATGIVRAAKLFYDRPGRSRRPLLKYARKLYKLRNCPIVIQYHHRGEAQIRGRRVEFLVSDFVEGEVLSRYLQQQRGKRLPAFEALHLLYSLAQGIEQIHFLGEYHGDVHSDNIVVKRRGLGFDVHLIDFFDLGRPSRERIQYDVYELLAVLYEAIGGAAGYRNTEQVIRDLVKGQKHSLIRRHFKTAGDLRLALENLDWNS